MLILSNKINITLGAFAVQKAFSGSAVLTARCAQDAKHAKKDILTAGYRRSQQLALIFLPAGHGSFSDRPPALLNSSQKTSGANLTGVLIRK